MSLKPAFMANHGISSGETMRRTPKCIDEYIEAEPHAAARKPVVQPK